MTAVEIDGRAVDRLLTVLGEHGRIERDLARKAIIAALPAPASGGAVAWRVGRDAVGWVLCKTLAEAEDEWLGPPDVIEPLYRSPESGAAEMRERAAREAETSKGYPTDVSERIRALPLTEPGSGD